MIYACENKFFLYKCVLLDGLLYFNPKIKITWRITGETGEVGLCIKISMPKGSIIPQYICVCILGIYSLVPGPRTAQARIRLVKLVNSVTTFRRGIDKFH